MTPERWAITMATVMASFPDWANSGQYAATGLCRSINPRSASRCTHVLVNPFDPENTLANVSCCQGRSQAASCQPPQRLTTSSPSTHVATAAPVSSRSAKLRSNCSRTAANSGAQNPAIGTSEVLTPNSLRLVAATPSISPVDDVDVVRKPILSRARNRTVIQTTFGLRLPGFVGGQGWSLAWPSDLASITFGDLPVALA